MQSNSSALRGAAEKLAWERGFQGWNQGRQTTNGIEERKMEQRDEGRPKLR